MSADKVLIIFLLQNYMYPLHVVVYPGLTTAYQASCIFYKSFLRGRAGSQRSRAPFYTSLYTAIGRLSGYYLSSWANEVKLQRIDNQCAALILDTLNRNSSRIITYSITRSRAFKFVTGNRTAAITGVTFFEPGFKALICLTVFLHFKRG